MLGKNVLFYSLDLCVLTRQELYEVQESRLVFGFVVVAVLDLALQGRKLDALLTCARVSAVHDGILRLWGEV